MNDVDFQFVDHPSPLSAEAYDRALERMCDRLSADPTVRSIYQIGGVSCPGISDLDMVVVFEDDARSPADPLDGMSPPDSYLFVHRLYGVPRSLFAKARPLMLFHNYRLLWGEPQPDGSGKLSESELQTVRVQTALEYLLKMYVNAAVSRVFRVIKLRGFFLHVKAVRFDLEFLEADTTPLGELTGRLIEHRKRWFEGAPSTRDLMSDLRAFYSELEAFLREEVKRRRFYMPGAADYRLSRSIMLRPGERLRFRHEGLVLPPALSRIGDAYFSLQHRLNRFHFELPAVTRSMPAPLARRFELASQLAAYNRRHLPHYAPLTSSLNLP